jgi:hypothetical protein
MPSATTLPIGYKGMLVLIDPKDNATAPSGEVEGVIESSIFSKAIGSTQAECDVTCR